MEIIRNNNDSQTPLTNSSSESPSGSEYDSDELRPFGDMSHGINGQYRKLSDSGFYSLKHTMNSTNHTKVSMTSQSVRKSDSMFLQNTQNSITNRELINHEQHKNMNNEEHLNHYSQSLTNKQNSQKTGFYTPKHSMNSTNHKSIKSSSLPLSDSFSQNTNNSENYEYNTPSFPQNIYKTTQAKPSKHTINSNNNHKSTASQILPPSNAQFPKKTNSTNQKPLTSHFPLPSNTQFPKNTNYTNHKSITSQFPENTTNLTNRISQSPPSQSSIPQNTIETEPESPDPTMDLLILHRLPGEKMGMVLGIEKMTDGTNKVYVRRVTVGGAAQRARGSSRGISDGDELVEVNGVELGTLSHAACVDMFREMPLQVSVRVRRAKYVTSGEQTEDTFHHPSPEHIQHTNSNGIVEHDRLPKKDAKHQHLHSDSERIVSKTSLKHPIETSKIVTLENNCENSERIGQEEYNKNTNNNTINYNNHFHNHNQRETHKNMKNITLTKPQSDKSKKSNENQYKNETTNETKNTEGFTFRADSLRSSLQRHKRNNETTTQTSSDLQEPILRKLELLKNSKLSDLRSPIRQCSLANIPRPKIRELIRQQDIREREHLTGPYPMVLDRRSSGPVDEGDDPGMERILRECGLVRLPDGFSVHRVKVIREEEQPLGLSIVPSYGTTKHFYQIKRLLPSGACCHDAQLHIGDRILFVNGVSLRGLKQQQCATLLRDTSCVVNFIILRQKTECSHLEIRINNTHVNKTDLNDSDINNKHTNTDNVHTNDICIDDAHINNDFTTINGNINNTNTYQQTSEDILSTSQSDFIGSESEQSNNRAPSASFNQQDYIEQTDLDYWLSSTDEDSSEESEELKDFADQTQSKSDINSNTPHEKFTYDSDETNKHYSDTERVNSYKSDKTTNFVVRRDISISPQRMDSFVNSLEKQDAIYHKSINTITNNGNTCFYTGENVNNNTIPVTVTSDTNSVTSDDIGDSHNDETPVQFTEEKHLNLIDSDVITDIPVTNIDDLLFDECEPDINSNAVYFNKNQAKMMDSSGDCDNGNIPREHLYSNVDFTPSNTRNDNIPTEYLYSNVDFTPSHTRNDNNIATEHLYSNVDFTPSHTRNDNSTDTMTSTTSNDECNEQLFQLYQTSSGNTEQSLTHSHLGYDIDNSGGKLPNVASHLGADGQDSEVERFLTADISADLSLSEDGNCSPFSFNSGSTVVGNLDSDDNNMERAEEIDSQPKLVGENDGNIEHVTKVTVTPQSESGSFGTDSVQHVSKIAVNRNITENSKENAPNITDRLNERETTLDAVIGGAKINNPSSNLSEQCNSAAAINKTCATRSDYQNIGAVPGTIPSDVHTKCLSLDRKSANIRPSNHAATSTLSGLNLHTSQKRAYDVVSLYKRCEYGPFQVDVLKGVIGLGLTIQTSDEGFPTVTDVQRGSPIAKNGNIRVGDYILSLNGTDITRMSDTKIQQISRLLPRGLVKVVASAPSPVHLQSQDKQHSTHQITQPPRKEEPSTNHAVSPQPAPRAAPRSRATPDPTHHANMEVTRQEASNSPRENAPDSLTNNVTSNDDLIDVLCQELSSANGEGEGVVNNVVNKVDVVDNFSLLVETSGPENIFFSKADDDDLVDDTACPISPKVDDVLIKDDDDIDDTACKISPKVDVVLIKDDDDVDDTACKISPKVDGMYDDFEFKPSQELCRSFSPDVTVPQELMLSQELNVSQEINVSPKIDVSQSENHNVSPMRNLSPQNITDINIPSTVIDKSSEIDNNVAHSMLLDSKDGGDYSDFHAHSSDSPSLIIDSEILEDICEESTEQKDDLDQLPKMNGETHAELPDEFESVMRDASSVFLLEVENPSDLEQGIVVDDILLMDGSEVITKERKISQNELDLMEVFGAEFEQNLVEKIEEDDDDIFYTEMRNEGNEIHQEEAKIAELSDISDVTNNAIVDNSVAKNIAEDIGASGKDLGHDTVVVDSLGKDMTEYTQIGTEKDNIVAEIISEELQNSNEDHLYKISDENIVASTIAEDMELHAQNIDAPNDGLSEINKIENVETKDVDDNIVACCIAEDILYDQRENGIAEDLYDSGDSDKENLVAANLADDIVLDAKLQKEDKMIHGENLSQNLSDKSDNEEVEDENIVANSIAADIVSDKETNIDGVDSTQRDTLEENVSENIVAKIIAEKIMRETSLGENIDLLKDTGDEKSVPQDNIAALVIAKDMSADQEITNENTNENVVTSNTSKDSPTVLVESPTIPLQSPTVQNESPSIQEESATTPIESPTAPIESTNQEITSDKEDQINIFAKQFVDEVIDKAVAQICNEKNDTSEDLTDSPTEPIKEIFENETREDILSCNLDKKTDDNTTDDDKPKDEEEKPKRDDNTTKYETPKIFDTTPVVESCIQEEEEGSKKDHDHPPDSPKSPQLLIDVVKAKGNEKLVRVRTSPDAPPKPLRLNSKPAMTRRFSDKLEKFQGEKSPEVPHHGSSNSISKGSILARVSSFETNDDSTTFSRSAERRRDLESRLQEGSETHDTTDASRSVLNRITNFEKSDRSSFSRSEERRKELQRHLSESGDSSGNTTKRILSKFTSIDQMDVPKYSRSAERTKAIESHTVSSKRETFSKEPTVVVSHQKLDLKAKVRDKVSHLEEVKTDVISKPNLSLGSAVKSKVKTFEDPPPYRKSSGYQSSDLDLSLNTSMDSESSRLSPVKTPPPIAEKPKYRSQLSSGSDTVDSSSDLVFSPVKNNSLESEFENLQVFEPIENEKPKSDDTSSVESVPKKSLTESDTTTLADDNNKVQDNTSEDGSEKDLDSQKNEQSPNFDNITPQPYKRRLQDIVSMEKTTPVNVRKMSMPPPSNRLPWFPKSHTSVSTKPSLTRAATLGDMKVRSMSVSSAPDDGPLVTQVPKLCSALRPRSSSSNLMSPLSPTSPTSPNRGLIKSPELPQKMFKFAHPKNVDDDDFTMPPKSEGPAVKHPIIDLNSNVDAETMKDQELKIEMTQGIQPKELEVGAVMDLNKNNNNKPEEQDQVGYQAMKVNVKTVNKVKLDEFIMQDLICTDDLSGNLDHKKGNRQQEEVNNNNNEEVEKRSNNITIDVIPTENLFRKDFLAESSPDGLKFDKEDGDVEIADLLGFGFVDTSNKNSVNGSASHLDEDNKCDVTNSQFLMDDMCMDERDMCVDFDGASSSHRVNVPALSHLANLSALNHSANHSVNHPVNVSSSNIVFTPVSSNVLCKSEEPAVSTNKNIHTHTNVFTPSQASKDSTISMAETTELIETVSEIDAQQIIGDTTNSSQTTHNLDHLTQTTLIASQFPTSEIDSLIDVNAQTDEQSTGNHSCLISNQAKFMFESTSEITFIEDKQKQSENTNNESDSVDAKSNSVICIKSLRKWAVYSSQCNKCLCEGNANVPTDVSLSTLAALSTLTPEDLVKYVMSANEMLHGKSADKHELVIVTLVREVGEKVGLTMKETGGNLVVCDVDPESTVGRSRRVVPDDLILLLNGESTHRMTASVARSRMRLSKDKVDLVVARSAQRAEMTRRLEQQQSTDNTHAPTNTLDTPDGPEGVFDVLMEKGVTGLGFCIEGGVGSPVGDRPITVKRLFKGGAADKSGKLLAHDEILEVNGQSLANQRHYEAWNMIRFAPDGPLTLKIRRPQT